jgi:hypothetical protein
MYGCDDSGVQAYGLCVLSCIRVIRRAVKKFPEMCYSTVMLGHTTKLT